MESSDAVAPHTEAGERLAEATPKARANYPGGWCMWGSHLSHRPRGEDSLLNCAVPGTLSRIGENPPYGISGGAAGDVAMGVGLRPTPKGVEPPPDPTVRAPDLDPTDERGVETGRGPDIEAPATERAGNSYAEPERHRATSRLYITAGARHKGLRNGPRKV